MKQTVNEYQFEQAFKEARPNNFTYDGLKALYDYLEQLGDDTGIEVELDVIALCCEYTEYENLGEYRNDYSDDAENMTDMSDIGEFTTVIPRGDEGFIIRQY